MCRRGNLTVPVVGVARSGMSLDDFRARVRASIGGLPEYDEAAAAPLYGLLRYIDGDYQDAETFKRLRAAIPEAKRPLHYLAISAEHVPDRDQGARRVGPRQERAGGDREAVRPRPDVGAGAEPDAAQPVRRGCDLPDRPLSRQGAGAEPGVFPFRQRVPRADLEPDLRGERAGHHGGGVRGGGSRPLLRRGRLRSATWSRTTCCRWSRSWRWSARSGTASTFLRDEKVKVFNRSGR